MDDTLRTRIQGLVEGSKVLLFMKGTKNFPQCGFSAQVIEVLKRTGAEFETVNILAEPEIRSGMKEYSNWPTFPQLYVDGRFVGGCDIVTDMYQSGELQPVIDTALGKTA
jgi:monothiol glutaredoxin